MIDAGTLLLAMDAAGRFNDGQSKSAEFVTAVGSNDAKSGSARFERLAFKFLSRACPGPRNVGALF